jgi:hypothetical protein
MPNLEPLPGDPDAGLLVFEARLAARLDAHAKAAGQAPTHGIALTTARGAMRSRPARRGRGAWLHALLSPAGVPIPLWLVLALLLAAASIVGVAARQLAAPPMPLVLSTETGLYLGAEGGDQLRPVREDGSYIAPRWSPSGDLIAALHGPPIRPQAGAAGGLPRTSVPYRLEVTSVRVLRPDGVLVLEVPGPAAGFVWGRARSDGRQLLAVRSVDGGIVILDATTGALVADVHADDPYPADEEPALMGPGIAWASADELLVADGAEIRGISVDTGTAPRSVARAAGGRINAIDVSADGRSAAFVVAPCRRGCRGELRVVTLAPGGPAERSDPAAGRRVASDIEASTVPRWSSDGTALDAWPYRFQTSTGAPATSLPTDPMIASRDVVGAWTRPADDGTNRHLVTDSYPYFNDRHFSAWIVDPDGAARRVSNRTLGIDLRESPR